MRHTLLPGSRNHRRIHQTGLVSVPQCAVVVQCVPSLVGQVYYKLLCAVGGRVLNGCDGLFLVFHELGLEVPADALDTARLVDVPEDVEERADGPDGLAEMLAAAAGAEGPVEVVFGRAVCNQNLTPD